MCANIHGYKDILSKVHFLSYSYNLQILKRTSWLFLLYYLEQVYNVTGHEAKDIQSCTAIPIMFTYRLAC